jgi:hypothetical protein
MLLFSINRSRGYENPSLDIIVTERCSIGGCPLEEACEHCYLIQSVISVAISYIISVYCEDYAGYFTVILSFLAFHFCSAYFIYLVSCMVCVPTSCTQTLSGTCMKKNKCRPECSDTTDLDLSVERTYYRLNTINTGIGRITQIFSKQYLL